MSNIFDFSGKVALVTGSSGGIGEAIATQLAQYGARVTITGRNEEKLAKVADKIQSIAGGDESAAPLQVIGDLSTDPELPRRLVEETIAKYGRLDILVNNAGASTPMRPLTDPQTLDDFDKIFQLNVRSVIELTQLSVPHLEASKGSVLNISSLAGLKPFANQLVYCSSKACLDMVTKTSALELGPKGIRVNSINPGPIATNFGQSLGMDDAAYKNFIETFTTASLMGRIGTVEDVANLAVFLSSKLASNITGSIYLNDSGYSLS